MVPISDGVGIVFGLYPYAARNAANVDGDIVSLRIILSSAMAATKTDGVVTNELLSDGLNYKWKKLGR